MSLRKTGKLVLTSFAATAVLLSSHTALANSTINELQNQKNSLSNQIDSTRDNLEEKKVELKKVQKDIDSSKNRLEELQKEIKVTNNDISIKLNKIATTKQEIKEIEELIILKTEELEAKKEKLKQHIQFMHSGGKVQFLEVLFRSDSLAQFINRYEKYNDIMNEAKTIHDEVVEELAFIEEQKRIVEEKKKVLENEKTALEVIKLKQVDQEKEQAALLKELEAKEEHIHDEIDETQEAMNHIANEVAKMEAQIKSEQAKILAEKQRKEEAARRAAAAVPSTSDKTTSSNTSISTSSTTGLGNGVLASPMKQGTYTLTSHFGYRIHPIHNTRSLHNGTDFGAPYGTPIYSMEDGFVLYAGAASGYGNWIVIKHDNGLYTGYAHMYSNQLYVSPGQRVTRGQKIAAVGSSGTSTGNHLHFFVSKNGPSSGFTDPLNYIQR